MSSGNTMQALRIVGYEQPFEFRDVPIPVAGPGEVVIKVGPLEKAMHAYQLMRKGKLKGRAVMTPNG